MKFYILIILFLLNCSATKTYLINRGNDLRDIPILGVEKDVYGFNTAILIPIFGISDNRDGKGIGIRHSHLGMYKLGDPDNKITVKNWFRGNEYTTHFGENIFIFVNSYHEPLNANTERTNDKIYIFFEFGKKNCRSTKIANIHYKNRVMECGISENLKFLPVELSAGLFLGFRVGFSAGEVFDFFAGIVGFDPLNDDIKDLNPSLRTKDE